MRKILPFSLLLGLFSLSASLKSFAAPGDTTWVQAQNDIQMSSHGNFDINVNFPSGTTTYYKILMYFTLGKYQCNSGDQYCGDWDYTVQNYLMTSTDTIELSRLITPYANATYPRTGWNWKQHYYFDVTDYASYLKNNAAIRIKYDGWSWGFSANIKFAFIEGTPPRNVTGVKKLFDGYYNYGDPADPIDSHVVPVSVTAPANTQFGELRFLITGHGGDGNGCSEFCYPYYYVKQNNNTLAQRQIFKSCGSNNLYPQSGTWIYDRANWCPGEGIDVHRYKFGSVTAGTTYTADIDWQSYTRSGTSSIPGYFVSGYMIHYGAWNRTLDASIEQIVAPTADENSFRSNPLCGSPVLVVKNQGSTTITSIQFSYGVTGQTAQTYTVTGLNLAAGDQTTVSLPVLTVLNTLPATASYQFSATILQANGAADGYAINNTMKSDFITSPIWPKDFTMVFKTNNAGSETKWKIEDMSGTIVAQRNPTTANTTFNDAISLTTNGCYKLTVTDAGCDGLRFWATAGSTGSGWIYPQAADGSIIPLTNGLPAYPNALTSDFGCGYTQYFRVTSNVVAGISNPAAVYSLSVTPNPFSSYITIEINTLKSYKANVQLIDSRGRVVRTAAYSVHAGLNKLEMDGLDNLASGSYLLTIDGEAGRTTRKIVKD